MNHRVIGYVRVSTIHQELSGAGLMAQENMIREFCKQHNFFLLDLFKETETGAEDNRTILHDAIHACKEQNANLIVAKLDRLSRKLSFIASFKETFQLDFFVANLGLEVNKIMIYLLAIFAELERDMISKRVKEGIAQKKRNSTYKKPKGNLSLDYIKGSKKSQDKSKVHRQQIFKEMQIICKKHQENEGKNKLTVNYYVEKLNERGNLTVQKKPWNKTNLAYMIRRYSEDLKNYQIFVQNERK